jgi:hypothetical protein
MTWRLKPGRTGHGPEGTSFSSPAMRFVGAIRPGLSNVLDMIGSQGIGSAASLVKDPL